MHFKQTKQTNNWHQWSPLGRTTNATLDNNVQHGRCVEQKSPKFIMFNMNRQRCIFKQTGVGLDNGWANFFQTTLWNDNWLALSTWWTGPSSFAFVIVFVFVFVFVFVIVFVIVSVIVFVIVFAIVFVF